MNRTAACMQYNSQEYWNCIWKTNSDSSSYHSITFFSESGILVAVVISNLKLKMVSDSGATCLRYFSDIPNMIFYYSFQIFVKSEKREEWESGRNIYSQAIVTNCRIFLQTAVPSLECSWNQAKLSDILETQYRP